MRLLIPLLFISSAVSQQITINGVVYTPTTTSQSAQVQVMFTVLGPEVDMAVAGLRVKKGSVNGSSIHLISVDIYNPSNGTVVLSSQRVAQEAASVPMQILPLAAMIAVASSISNKNKGQIIMDIGSIAATSAILMLATRSVTARPGFALGLSFISPLKSIIDPLIQKREPMSSLLTTGGLSTSISLAPHSGTSGIVAVRCSDLLVGSYIRTITP